MANVHTDMQTGFLFTDQYQLSMAQLYFRCGFHEEEVQFDHFFRHYPDYGNSQAGYCIHAGLASFLDWLQHARIRDVEIDALRKQESPTGQKIFDDDFLDWLAVNGTYEKISMRAIPEGRVVHPNEPLSIIQGPLAICQILETSILNHLNFQTLIATKASRVKRASLQRPLLEFGLRRAQAQGGNDGCRAALIGGADFSSNVGMSLQLGFPPRGTHAHSLVQFFLAKGMQEIDAFRAYAETYPDNCILLVDTIDSLHSGVPHAIEIFEELRRKGYEPKGIRLDSGDLAYLAVQSARMLDEAGFNKTWIVLSGDLDEILIWQIHKQIEEEALSLDMVPANIFQRLVYGVGTRLITSWGAPALAAAYKLVATKENGNWKPAIKVSDSAAKVPNPGPKNLWRIYDKHGYANADVVGLVHEDPRTSENLELRHPSDETSWRTIPQSQISRGEPLLLDIIKDGGRVYEPPPLDEIRRVRDADLERLNPGVKRLIHPHIYHVSLSKDLWALKKELLASSKYTPTA